MTNVRLGPATSPAPRSRPRALRPPPGRSRPADGSPGRGGSGRARDPAPTTRSHSAPARLQRRWPSPPKTITSRRGKRDKISGLISTRHGFGLPSRIIEILEAGHPVPDANSIAGAKRAIELAKSAGPNDLVLCLLSGGASAIWSAPAAGVSFEAKQALTKQLFKSGAPISEMNSVRKHLSEIKGGKLAAAVYPARLLTLAISDVPRDNPDEIGSGPTVADRATLADARAVLAKWKITPAPEIARALLEDPRNETLKAGDAKLANSSYKIVAAPTASLEAAAQAARGLGYRVVILGDALEGEARDVARAHARWRSRQSATARKVAIVWIRGFHDGEELIRRSLTEQP